MTSAPFCTKRTTVLGSHISWLSFPHNFSQRSYNQKFHLLKIKMSGTIGFFSSCFLFLCSESSQSFLHPSCTYLHFNTEICPHVSKYCISLSCPVFPSMELPCCQPCGLQTTWLFFSTSLLVFSVQYLVSFSCVSTATAQLQTFCITYPYITGKS